MKKLSFMFVAVALAVTANAASVKWTCTNVKKDGTAINGIAYFVNAATLSQDKLATLNSAKEITEALGNSYNWTPTTAGNYGNTVANSVLGLADATTGYSAYLLIFDTAQITDDSKYYTTKVKEFDTVSGDYQASLGWAGQASRISQVGWTNATAEAVPEPTSGLLMLLGMAGLALRRKRA